MEVRLPELGEGIDSATIVNLLVKVGDSLTIGQNILAVETDKAAVEVPTEQAGVVEAILVKPGDKIAVGSPLLKLSSAGVTAVTLPIQPAAEPLTGPSPVLVEIAIPQLGEGIESATVVAVPVKIGEAVDVGQTLLTVETDKAAVDIPAEVAGTIEAIHLKPGDKVPIGAKAMSLRSKTLTSAVASSRPQPVDGSGAPKVPVVVPGVPAPVAVLDPSVIAAGPATRRLARELGINLKDVRGSARGNRITLDDVKAFVRERIGPAKAGGSAALSLTGKTVAESFQTPPFPDFARYGEVERKSVSQIRRKIAENLTIGWRTMPMVTQHDLADITELEAGRKRIVESTPKGAPKVTMTVLAIKAVVTALREFAHFNASYDMNVGELVYKKYYHIGIAVDTERGLVVPVIRDADKKSIRDLATELATLAEKARAGKLAIDEMRGGTFTITNLGGIGGTAFTPIVNYPEVAILGMSRSSQQPVIREGQIVPRLMLPLSLTYDHRVVDGADGARFTTRLVQLFSDPLRLLLES